MEEMIFASPQGRNIPKEDKIFGINNRAKAMIAEEGKEKVVNATIGALLDDDGELIVLSSVNDVFKKLSPKEFAEYAPISGTPEFKKAVKQDALRGYEPKGFVEASATPGGTGAIRNTIANYTDRGDSVLVADWYWLPYGTIAAEQGRKVETFAFFNDKRKFNAEDFKIKAESLLSRQQRLVIILNTPAHNPTGYSLTTEDWNNVKTVLEVLPAEKKITLLVDVAYIDFAGDEEEYRSFLPILEDMPENVLTLISHSLSKAYTLYGMRCGALICLAKTEEIAEEFKRVCEFSSRASWSNCARAPQVILSKIYSDPELKAKVFEERQGYREMLLRRGRAFEKAAADCGLEMVPFDAGFFASIPCSNPDEVAARLEKEGIFLVPLAKGLRVSVASVSEEVCRMLPARILAAMK